MYQLKYCYFELLIQSHFFFYYFLLIDVNNKIKFGNIFITWQNTIFFFNREYFVNNHTGELLKPGDTYTMAKLGQTLRVIANEGANSIYAGSLTPNLVYDLQSSGGIITKKDFIDYSWVDKNTIKLTKQILDIKPRNYNLFICYIAIIAYNVWI